MTLVQFPTNSTVLFAIPELEDACYITEGEVPEIKAVLKQIDEFIQQPISKKNAFSTTLFPVFDKFAKEFAELIMKSDYRQELIAILQDFLNEKLKKADIAILKAEIAYLNSHQVSPSPFILLVAKNSIINYLDHHDSDNYNKAIDKFFDTLWEYWDLLP